MSGRARSDHPIDFQHLDQYTLADDALEREVLRLFCDHARDTFGRLRATGDSQERRRLIHSLKGSARGVGAWALADAADAAEADLADGGASADGAVDLTALERRLDEACGFVETFLGAG